MKTSIIIPSKGCTHLSYALRGLRDQSIKPSEVILVVKDCKVEFVENLCRSYDLSCIIIEQKEGYFTHALNIGKREARGDIIIFTDDDAIPLRTWVERWVKYHKLFRNVAGISSRDIHLDLNKLKILPTPDVIPSTRLYRWFIRTWFEKPITLLEKYKLGVYITRKYNVAHGPYIPYRLCFSLPFRGVNMSFKAEYIYNVWFPEHHLLKRAPGNEQYFGLQLILKGYDTIYIPNNPILHISRESLSRPRNKKVLELEINIMREFFKRLLEDD